jgi:hypothetical protein
MLAKVEEEHVRRWVDHAQRAVDGKRMRIGRNIYPLGQHDLEDVSVMDILLGPIDYVAISLWRSVWPEPIDHCVQMET